MEIYEGQLIEYTFPKPVSESKRFVTGVVEYIAEDFIKVRTGTSTYLKISFKNFENIKILETEEVY